MSIHLYTLWTSPHSTHSCVTTRNISSGRLLLYNRIYHVHFYDPVVLALDIANLHRDQQLGLCGREPEGIEGHSAKGIEGHSAKGIEGHSAKEFKEGTIGK